MDNVALQKLSVISPGSLGYRLRQTYQQRELTTPDGSVDLSAQATISLLIDYLSTNLETIESISEGSNLCTASTFPVAPQPAELASKCTIVLIYAKRVVRFENGDTNVSLSHWTSVYDKSRPTKRRFETCPTVAMVTARHARYHELAADDDMKAADACAREFVATMGSLASALNVSEE
ncbi:hypothetical protein H9P43_006880 [Blastocladiella emersonii ATCC 22665]|nr:hypothetical protein H9P43_006880 [Blastocladiella emersonii ATCC 22665]